MEIITDHADSKLSRWEICGNPSDQCLIMNIMHVDDEYIFDYEGSIMTLATPVMRRVHQPRLYILFLLYAGM